MYKPKQVKDKKDIFNYINGDDVYNSALIINMKDITESSDTIATYTTKHSDKRLDLIADNVGLSESFISLLNKFFKGDKIKTVKYFIGGLYNSLTMGSVK